MRLSSQPYSSHTHLREERSSKAGGLLSSVVICTGLSDAAVARYASPTARLSVGLSHQRHLPLQEDIECEEQVSLDSLSSILRVARAEGHPARLAFVHAMPAAAAAVGRAGAAAELLPLAVELASDADEAVRQAVALQLAPLGERPSPQCASVRGPWWKCVIPQA